jgi:hypothetical protein
MNQGRVASTSRVGELAAAPGESSVSHAAQRVIVAEGVARAGRRSRLAAAYNEARSRAESEGDDLGLGIEAYAVVAAVREDMTVEEVLAGLRSQRPSLLRYVTQRSVGRHRSRG